MTHASNNPINRVSVTGKISWLQYYPERHKAVLIVKNEQGGFFVEFDTPTQPTWKVDDVVLVDGILFSHRRKGRLETGIQANAVKALRE
jgi:hypothetical protein